MKTIIPGLLYKLYFVRRNVLRKFILRYVNKLEGGQMLSETLRRILSNYHNIEIGLYTYGSCFDVQQIAPFTKIGRYCSFASGVVILGQNHPLDFKSTHPYFYNPIFKFVDKQLNRVNKLIIGNDVWIGSNAVVTPSVSEIGDGAIIGAGSVVTKNVPDYAVVAGNPARVIKFRHKPETIRRLKEEKWWDKTIDDIKGNLDDFTSPL